MERDLTLREYIHRHNNVSQDIDVVIDGTETCISICFGDIRITSEAEKHFAKCLDLMVVTQDDVIISLCSEDYDEYNSKQTGLISLTEEFVNALAGFCSHKKYQSWFEGKTNKI